MDCCGRGCPLNKSTNKNANVNIFSHNFFHLEWGMKISHYIDRQQREQLTTYTVNEKDDFATPHFITCIWNDGGFLGVSTLQRTKGNLSSTSIHPTPILSCKTCKFLGFWGRQRSFTLVYLSINFKDLLQQRTIDFSFALSSL